MLYFDNLMEKTLRFCTKDDKPTLPTPPPPLASTSPIQIKTLYPYFYDINNNIITIILTLIMQHISIKDKRSTNYGVDGGC